MSRKEQFNTEAALVAAFIEGVKADRVFDYDIYPETGGFDLLLVQRGTGIQIGIEAKLSLNNKVVAQALGDNDGSYGMSGPDYRAVLVPHGGIQSSISPICHAIGLTILSVNNAYPDAKKPHWRVYKTFPNEMASGCWSLRGWHPWCPIERIKLPDYVPDVKAGVPSPIVLTEWKIKAIKLMIILERRGYVTRRDMRVLDISPTRWTDAYHGMLTPSAERGGYMACKRTPDFRKMHPQNYPQIEADIAEWSKGLDSLDPPEPPGLLKGMEE